MQVETILQSKGRAVTTVSTRATIAEAVDLLNTQRIGAVVVMDGTKVVGILSERDIVRHLGKDWASLATRPVSEVMTRNVVITSSKASIADLMERMTEHRIRHIPVVEAGELVGIVSIGDVVKRKIEETEQEAIALKEYIAS
ncbi:MAG: CBS domain-containing protein [Devosia nanyangense]|uniref:CBS domain-containing protein n=1 Tax=Devosia nanyangense TaxID=1228055 RepID=A0A933L0L1_9HYPH|nr:CBS domain-containing protein [Devosia nanyangense]